MRRKYVKKILESSPLLPELTEYIAWFIEDKYYVWCNEN